MVELLADGLQFGFRFEENIFGRNFQEVVAKNFMFSPFLATNCRVLQTK